MNTQAFGETSLVGIQHDVLVLVAYRRKRDAPFSVFGKGNLKLTIEIGVKNTANSLDADSDSGEWLTCSIAYRTMDLNRLVFVLTGIDHPAQKADGKKEQIKPF